MSLVRRFHQCMSLLFPSARLRERRYGPCVAWCRRFPWHSARRRNGWTTHTQTDTQDEELHTGWLLLPPANGDARPKISSRILGGKRYFLGTVFPLFCACFAAVELAARARTNGPMAPATEGPYDGAQRGHTTRTCV